MEPTATETQTKQTIPLKDISSSKISPSISSVIPIILVLAITGLGIFSGLVLFSRQKNLDTKASISTEENLNPEMKESFAKTFKDEAQGTIERNDDLDQYAQGTHKLIREGGESQTAFLTSSVLDLDEFVGKKVKVFGETFGSEQVGWLMDVGKVEELN